MYNTFFGFKEKPFTLNPDPEYIFLSKSHDEVLSHLTYAIYEGNGFAKITGKVGSGKTLLCRTFLEGLDESVNSAYIFNPKLDSIQLLKTINDEFGIESHEPFDEKSLVDSLNNFLIRQKTEGKKSVLIIDEAQELSIDALEQIRLLSNLETIKNKLIQIIIVGQSELNLLLEKHELRQLAQRISLSCELSSLTFAETKDYISHRLHIASRRRGDIFSKDAVKEIYEYSKGIPRLINIVCDRMLLTAFSNNSKYVTKKIAEITLDEIHQVRKQRVSFNYRIVIAGIIGIIFLAISLFFIVKYDKTPIAFNEKISSEKTPVPRIEEPAPVTKKTVPSVEARLPVKKAGIESILVDSSEMRAVKDIIKLWNVEFNDPVVPLLDNSGMNMFFDSIGQYNNFMVKKLGADIMLLKKLNIPAILELNPIEAGGPKFVVLTGIAEDKDEVVLTSGEDSVIVSVRELYTNRFSNAYIFWKNFFNIVGTPPFDTSPSSISSLKILLRNIGFTDIIPNYEFDMDTDTAIRATQKKHGVLQDGIVGSLTKIILYNELGTLDIPHIRFGAERSE